MDTLASLTAALAGRYSVEQQIGQGGMATVYLARDLRHNSRVAVKVLRRELAAVMGGQRFTREIQITATLQHPNILPLLDSGEADGLPYYVMPFVEGESLGQRLERETRLSLEEGVRLIAEVADGLEHAHAKGFVHRDIKPANILLSHGHAIIADFGVARALIITGADRLTDSGMAIGTAAYMSPEQAGAERIDGRSDIYSLGCVLYEVLSGAPPFTGPSAQAIMARNAVDPVPSLRTVRQGVPQALEAVINKALAKVPEDRYATAGEFRDAIVRAATMPVTAETRGASARPWWRSGPALLAAGIVLVLGAAAVIRQRTARPALDTNRVMVFPLLLPGDWRGSSTAGEDVATIIGSAMDGAGALRWVDGWQLLTPAQRDEIRTLGIREAMAIARTQGCAFAITGRLVARGDSADVFLELYDSQTGTVLTRPSGTALASESWRGGMRAINEILLTLIPTQAPDVEAEWRARPPQAVAHFLLGESAFRRVQLGSALSEFQKAIEVDSTFGLAAVRGAQVASWNHQRAEAEALIRLAIRSKLSPRYQLFAEGFGAYLDGRADTAAARFRAALVLDSTMLAAWAQLGEVYMHLLPTVGRTDSLAEMAFTHGRALDSTAATLQYHLVEILARRGDQAGSAALARSFARVAEDSMLAREVELVSACGPGGMKGVDLREAAAQRPLPLILAAKYLGASPLTSHCTLAAEAMLLQEDTARTDAADGRRFYSLLGLVSIHLGRGNSAAAVKAIEEFRLRWGQGRSLYLLAAPVVPELGDSARAVAREDSVRGGPNYAGIRFPVRLWELGVWAAVEGRKDVATAVAKELATRAAAGARVDTLIVRSMAAHAALANGDSARAEAEFERLIAAPSPPLELTWNEPASLGFDRLVLGRLLIARKQYDRALGVLEVHESALPAIFPLYRKASLSARIQAAEALGKNALAAALRTRVAALSVK